MRRPLFLEKMTDKELKELIDVFETINITGTTDNEKVLHLAETWYSFKTGVERLIFLQADVYKEAAYRWSNLI